MARRTAGAVLCLLALAATACTGSDDPKTPAATVDKPSTTEPSTTTTSEPQTPEQEVEAAYLMSWDIYANAMRSLDVARLEDAFAKDALALRQREVEALKADGKAGRMQVDHRIAAVRVDGHIAKVLDNYINHSVLIDPSSGEPVEPVPSTPNSRTYTLERIDGTWYVTFVLDNAPSSPSSSQS